MAQIGISEPSARPSRRRLWTRLGIVAACAALGLLILVGFFLVRLDLRSSLDDLSAQGEALVRAGDAQAHPMAARAGGPPGAQGVVYTRPGVPLAVVDLNRLTPRPDGSPYNLYVEQNGILVARGTVKTDAQGHGRFICRLPLATPLSRVWLAADDNEVSSPTVLIWPG